MPNLNTIIINTLTTDSAQQQIVHVHDNGFKIVEAFANTEHNKVRHVSIWSNSKFGPTYYLDICPHPNMDEERRVVISADKEGLAEQVKEIFLKLDYKYVHIVPYDHNPEMVPTWNKDGNGTLALTYYDTFNDGESTYLDEGISGFEHFQKLIDRLVSMPREDLAVAELNHPQLWVRLTSEKGSTKFKLEKVQALDLKIAEQVSFAIADLEP